MQGASPLTTRLGRWLIRRILNRVDTYVARDPKTLVLLPALSRVLRDRMNTALTRYSLEWRGWFNDAAGERFLKQSDDFLVRHHSIESRVRAKFALLLTVLEEWARLFLDPKNVGARP